MRKRDHRPFPDGSRARAESPTVAGVKRDVADILKAALTLPSEARGPVAASFVDSLDIAAPRGSIPDLSYDSVAGRCPATHQLRATSRQRFSA